ncbi:MAG: arginine repressor [Acidobacteriota bacterium]
MLKGERQQKIVKFIGSGKVARQEQLAEMLNRSGVHTTQASISRDLDELGVVKLGGYYSLPTKDSLASPLGPITVETAGANLVVVRCRSGLASAAAVNIDAGNIEGIVGTIAGDDTIFIAVQNARVQKTVVKRILDLI